MEKNNFRSYSRSSSFQNRMHLPQQKWLGSRRTILILAIVYFVGLITLVGLSGCGNSAGVQQNAEKNSQEQAALASMLAKASLKCEEPGLCSEAPFHRTGLIVQRYHSYNNFKGSEQPTASQCTGTVLGSRFVLTNTHCIPVSVKIGAVPCGSVIGFKLASQDGVSGAVAHCKTLHAFNPAVSNPEIEGAQVKSLEADLAVFELDRDLDLGPVALKKALQVGASDSEEFFVPAIDPIQFEGQTAPAGLLRIKHCVAISGSQQFLEFQSPRSLFVPLFPTKPMLSKSSEPGGCRVIPGNSGSSVYTMKRELIGVLFSSVLELPSDSPEKNPLISSPAAPVQPLPIEQKVIHLPNGLTLPKRLPQDMAFMVNLGCIQLSTGVGGIFPDHPNCLQAVGDVETSISSRYATNSHPVPLLLPNIQKQLNDWTEAKRKILDPLLFWNVHRNQLYNENDITQGTFELSFDPICFLEQNADKSPSLVFPDYGFIGGVISWIGNELNLNVAMKGRRYWGTAVASHAIDFKFSWDDYGRPSLLLSNDRETDISRIGVSEHTIGSGSPALYKEVFDKKSLKQSFKLPLNKCPSSYL